MQAKDIFTTKGHDLIPEDDRLILALGDLVTIELDMSTRDDRELEGLKWYEKQEPNPRTVEGYEWVRNTMIPSDDDYLEFMEKHADECILFVPQKDVRENAEIILSCLELGMKVESEIRVKNPNAYKPFDFADVMKVLDPTK